jgi:hypothetical protein
MIATNPLVDALPLVAALAEELAFAVTSDLMAEQYRRPSPALERLAAAKAFLDLHQHPIGPNTLEAVEIATVQGSLPS